MQIIDDVYGRTLEYTPDVEGEMPSEEEILEGFGTMYGDALVFDKLHENKEYIQDLKDDYKSTEGKEFKGNLTDLIESDFEYWNLVDNSIIAGASETVLTFKDMSKEESDIIKKIWWNVHKEDHEICERLQEGRLSPASDQGGLLSPYWEKGVQTFQKLIIQATMKSAKTMKGKKNV